MAIVARADPGRRPPLVALLAAAALALGGCAAVAPSTSPDTSSAAPATAPAARSAPACAPGIPSTAPRPWWETAVFYEVFVRSFADADGDGIGDLDGLRAHLDYLNDDNAATTDDLGVTALWLMPVAESPSYHGYDVTNYTKIEPDYGDAAGFRALVTAAHQRGIKVIVDFEANHTSKQHPWFVDALQGGAHHDWYIWSKDDPGWPNPIGAGDPWRASNDGYYYALFWQGMPDLNLRNRDATAELNRVAGFWLDDLGVDGLRIDAARHLIEDGPEQQVNTPETRAWLTAFRDVAHTDEPSALVVGEVNDAELTSGSYVSDGSLDMSFDFEIGPAILNAVSHADANSLAISEAGIGKAYPHGGAGTFLSNHDETRVMSQLRGDGAAAAVSAGTLLTAPGTPFVYYGEEIGMTGDKPDEQIRTPFPWTTTGPGYGFTTGAPWEPFADGATSANVATETGDPASLLSTYRDLVRLRLAHPALATAPFVTLESSDPHIVASLRAQGGDRLLVLQNLAGQAARDPVLRLRQGPLCGPLSAAVLYPAPLATSAVAAPIVNSTGGFDGYRPLASIPGQSTVVVSLSP